jgi:glutathione S-transferase
VRNAGRTALDQVRVKLYFSPGACSLSPHIVAAELGLDVALEKVDLAAKKTATGADYLKINPKGYVPALALDNGELLTEGPVIVQYLADKRPDAKLAPPSGSFERYRLQEVLGYINSELHKTYSPLFRPVSDELRADRIAYLQKRYGYINDLLGKQPYLLGDQFTVADAYLFTVTNWAKRVNLDLAAYPNVLAFQARVAARPAVIKAMSEEGLLPKAS